LLYDDISFKYRCWHKWTLPKTPSIEPIEVVPPMITEDTNAVEIEKVLGVFESNNARNEFDTKEVTAALDLDVNDDKVIVVKTETAVESKMDRIRCIGKIFGQTLTVNRGHAKVENVQAFPKTFKTATKEKCRHWVDKVVNVQKRVFHSNTKNPDGKHTATEKPHGSWKTKLQAKWCALKGKGLNKTSKNTTNEMPNIPSPPQRFASWSIGSSRTAVSVSVSKRFGRFM
jgi:hypothetical protein